MRKIIVTGNITLDGVMQAPGGPEEDATGKFKYGGWGAPYNDDEGGMFVLKELQEKAEYLLGKTTFDIWAGFWPKHADIWPGINEGTKYVMAKTDKTTDWKNTVFIDSVEDIKKLKESDGPDIQVWGSSQIVQLLVENDLVDEMRLKIHPIILGAGKKLFGDSSTATAFTLADSLVTSTGVIIATYKRAGEVKLGTTGATIGIED
jgi:dihydrofolate reductase